MAGLVQGLSRPSTQRRLKDEAELTVPRQITLQELDIFLAKTEAHARMFGNEDFHESPGETTQIHNPMRELRRGMSFFIFLASNPLKRLDSEKEMKRNERTFAFICFYFFAFPWCEFAPGL
jgi:hypothetical protein